MYNGALFQATTVCVCVIFSSLALVPLSYITIIQKKFHQCLNRYRAVCQSIKRLIFKDNNFSEWLLYLHSKYAVQNLKKKGKYPNICKDVLLKNSNMKLEFLVFFSH